MNGELVFAKSRVADDDYPGPVHIRTNKDVTPGHEAIEYAVYDDVKQVSDVFYAPTYSQAKAFADGYATAKYGETDG